MCNQWCLQFAQNALSLLPEQCRVLEAGARDVNGSIRQVFGDRAREWVGIDIEAGPGVDLIADVVALEEHVPAESFDLVASTEMLEHCRDWQEALWQMMRAVKRGGIVLLTTRSPGFAFHDYPGDHWRFTLSDLKQALAPAAKVLCTGIDRTLDWPCGVGIVVRRTVSAEKLAGWRPLLRSRQVYQVDPRVDKPDVHRPEAAIEEREDKMLPGRWQLLGLLSRIMQTTRRAASCG